MKVEIVGSFLPSEDLINARCRYCSGEIDRNRFEQIEDEAVADLVERQLQSGLTEVTSGELRRTYWDKDFYFGLEGISREYVNSGRVYQNVEVDTDLVRIDGCIAYNPEHPFFDDFRFLNKTVAGRAVCRQTLPSPANLYFEILTMTDGHPERVYPASECLLSDIARAYRDTILHFYTLGCRSIQLDDTACGLLCDGNFTKRLLQGGIDLVALHDDVIALINDSLEGLPADMELSMYMSGGDNVVPEWGFPDNIIPKILSHSRVDKFFMPFDLGDDSQPEVLRYLPAGKKVALGLVDAHSPFPDKMDRIKAVVSVAEKYVPESMLSVCPKTGFKLTNYIERGLNYEDQWNKLAQMGKLFR